MLQLRWVLLLLGVVFLAGLAWWELRRPRQSRRGDLAGPPDGESAPAYEAQREPTLTLSEMHVRDPLPELPMIEVVDDSEILRIDEDRDEDIDLLAGEADEPFVPSPELPAMLDPLLDEQRALVAPLAARADPIIEWPDEGMRRILALRLIASSERFPGHAVRQALTAEGFVLGKLAIFHRAGPDGRAVVSVANLTKPGTFDRESIDMQRFGGLSLFSVLPGPLPPVRAFDELLASARSLSDRLQGELQDERGETLTPLRAAEIREELEAQTENES
jgi:FtsZ-interacting cell division protein ZipA